MRASRSRLPSGDLAIERLMREIRAVSLARDAELYAGMERQIGSVPRIALS